MIKTLLKSVREYKVPSILCPIVMVGEAVMEILIPFMMTFIVGQLQDLAEFGTPINITDLVICAVLMVACAVFALL